MESDVPTPPSWKTQQAAGALEGVLAAQVDRATGRVGVHAGRERVVELDRLDAGDRHLLERVLATGVVVRRGGGHAGAVDGELGVLRIEAADANGGGVHFGVVERDARHGLHELAHVAHGQCAEVVGGDHVLGIHGGATFHDRARLAFALGGNDHHVHLVRIDASGSVRRHLELEIHRHCFVGNDRGGCSRLLQAGVLGGDGDVAGRHAVETEDTAVFGVSDDRRAFDANLRVAHVLARRGIQDATAHAASAHLLARLRARRSTARLLEQNHIAFVGLDRQARASEQRAQRFACIHLAGDGRRADSFQRSRRRDDLHLSLPSQLRNGSDRGLRGNFECALLRHRVGSGSQCGGNGTGQQDVLVTIHIRCSQQAV